MRRKPTIRLPSLATNIALTISSAIATTFAEITLATTCPVARRQDASTVEASNVAGTVADAADCTSRDVPPTARPRCASARPTSLGLVSRLATVPEAGRAAAPRSCAKRPPARTGQATRDTCPASRQVPCREDDQGRRRIQAPQRRIRPCRSSAFVPMPFRAGCADLERGLESDAVQPVADHAAWLDRRGPADQNEEGGLKRILGIVAIAQDPPTNAPYHRGVAMHDRFEGR